MVGIIDNDNQTTQLQVAAQKRVLVDKSLQRYMKIIHVNSEWVKFMMNSGEKMSKMLSELV